MGSGSSTAQTSNDLKACTGCHKTGNITNIPGNTTNYHVTNITANTNAHAAVTLECVTCHDQVTSELEGSEAAHTQYYWNSTSSNQSTITLKGANTACIGCPIS